MTSFMAVVFHRPKLIPPGDSVPQPTQTLDDPTASPEIPSPTVAKVLENQLARQLVETDPNAYLDMLLFMDSWMLSLPPAYAVNNPDTRWDAQYPRLAFQRLQLHTVGYMTQLIIMRPHITSRQLSARDRLPGTERSCLLHQAVDVSLKAMTVSKNFFDLCFPQQAKYFMVAFCPFDNAALLCSLLSHDIEKNELPRRLEIAAAIGTAIYISQRMKGYAKLGDAASSILTSLISHLDLLPSEKAALERSANTVQTPNGNSAAIESHSVSSFESMPNGQQSAFANNDWGLAQDPISVNDPTQRIDLGILDGLYDWEGLQMDFIDDSLV